MTTKALWRQCGEGFCMADGQVKVILTQIFRRLLSCKLV
jgi:hypothetical protein